MTPTEKYKRLNEVRGQIVFRETAIRTLKDDLFDLRKEEAGLLDDILDAEQRKANHANP